MTMTLIFGTRDPSQLRVPGTVERIQERLGLSVALQRSTRHFCTRAFETGADNDLNRAPGIPNRSRERRPGEEASLN